MILGSVNSSPLLALFFWTSSVSIFSTLFWKRASGEGGRYPKCVMMRRALTCGKGRQILQLRLDVLDVAPERVDQSRDVGDVAAADAADGLLGHRIIVSYHRIVALARTCT